MHKCIQFHQSLDATTRVEQRRNQVSRRFRSGNFCTAVGSNTVATVCVWYNSYEPPVVGSFWELIVIKYRDKLTNQLSSLDTFNSISSRFCIDLDCVSSFIVWKLSITIKSKWPLLSLLHSFMTVYVCARFSYFGSDEYFYRTASLFTLITLVASQRMIIFV
jgi:hypothetical protein